MFWRKAQARLSEERQFEAAIHGASLSSSPSRPKSRALEGAELEAVLMGMARQFPNNVEVVHP